MRKQDIRRRRLISSRLQSECVWLPDEVRTALTSCRLVQAVREDVAWLKANKYMKGIKVYGFVLKLEDGTVHPVHRLAEE